MHKARFCSLKETKILSDIGAADKNARSRKKVKGEMRSSSGAGAVACCHLLEEGGNLDPGGSTKTLSSSSYLLSHAFFVSQRAVRPSRPRSAAASTVEGEDTKESKELTVDGVVLSKEMCERNATLKVRRTVSLSLCRMSPRRLTS